MLCTGGRGYNIHTNNNKNKNLSLTVGGLIAVHVRINEFSVRRTLASQLETPVSQASPQILEFFSIVKVTVVVVVVVVVVVAAFAAPGQWRTRLRRERARGRRAAGVGRGRSLAGALAPPVTQHADMKFCTMYKITYVSRKKKLEDRGVTLVETLFERRSARVTFTQFRNGLLSVLGASEPAPLPSAAAAAAPPAAHATSATHSDEESSGREVAPKFVFGSKKYGRRSRPQHVTSDAAPRPRVASDSRLGGERSRQRERCKRSASAMESRASSAIGDVDAEAAVAELAHDRRVDRERALSLCRSLQMSGINSRLVNGVFEDMSTDEITVGDFFDRLNVSLSTSIAASLDGAAATAHEALSGSGENETEDALSSDAVVEAWECAGVQRPRRLLIELGFSSATVRPSKLERALDDELLALTAPPDGQADARNLLFLASLALSRLRLERSEQRLNVSVTERDKLRVDLVEANRRARLLAQDVDENHARIEAELKSSLRQVESRHAEAARAAAAEVSGERERAAATRALLEQEVARRADAELRLRAELVNLHERLKDSESRAAAADEKAQQADRERARLAAECKLAKENGDSAVEASRLAASRLEAMLEDLRLENKSLRDRNDELCAELEAARRAGRVAGGAAGGGAPWRDEAPLDTSLPLLGPCECESTSPAAADHSKQSSEADKTLRGIVRSIQDLPLLLDGKCETCSTVARIIATLEQGAAEVAAEGAAVGSRAPGGPCAGAARLAGALAAAKRSHAEEKSQLVAVVSELEASLDQLKVDYDKCEEYWSSKMEEEREMFNEEQRAGDERLAELVGKIGEYERQFSRAPLPTIEERAALEHQVTALEEEFAAYRRDKEAELVAQRDELARAKRRLEELERGVQARGGRDAAPHPAPPRPTGCAPCAPCAECPPCACACVRPAAALRARAARAERAAQRLAARLAAADLLVKDLYLENCRLAHRPRLP